MKEFSRLLRTACRPAWLAPTMLLLWCAAPVAADEVQLNSGTKYVGKILSRSDSEVTIQVVSGSGTATFSLPMSAVKDIKTGPVPAMPAATAAPAATASPKASAMPSPAATPAPRPTAAPSAAKSGGQEKTRAEIDRMIDDAGRKQPEWWDQAQLNYPNTLDLTFQDVPKGVWDTHRKVGCYLWSVVYPNPGRWKDGIKLLHHMLVVNKDNPKALQSTMTSLGYLYFNCLQDYARAAFWMRKAGSGTAADMAYCYWYLGSKSMAVELIRSTTFDGTRHCNIIKLWAEMGEVKKALDLAESTAGAGRGTTAYLAAGNVCRSAGDYKQAIAYYQKAIAAPLQKNGWPRDRDIAKASLQTVQVAETLDLSKIKDGTYNGVSQGYIDLVYVDVVIKGGRIEAVNVTRHREDQAGAGLIETPKRIVARQGIKGVVPVTGATVSSDAVVNAAVQALASAMKQ